MVWTTHARAKRRASHEPKPSSANKSRLIYQHSKMAPRLSGQNCKFFKFPLFSIPKRDLNTKKPAPNIEVCPEATKPCQNIDMSNVAY